MPVVVVPAIQPSIYSKKAKFDTVLLLNKKNRTTVES